MRSRPSRLAAVAAVMLALASGRAAAAGWPGLERPLPKTGGGDRDAALVVGIENYAFVPSVAGAADNARDWYAWLTRTRSVPVDAVRLVVDRDAALESLREEAARVAKAVKAGGTLWVVFIGHGAPAADGKDGLLVGVDAQQTASSLAARSLRQRELLSLLSAGKQARTVLVVDACFSGRTADGSSLAPGLQPLVALSPAASGLDRRTLVLSAGSSKQFAGPLPGANRPAFSYLALGALRGWGDADADGRVSGAEVVAYARTALAALLKGRQQTPEAAPDDGRGVELASLGGRGEAGPDLTELVLWQAGARPSPAAPPAPFPKAPAARLAPGPDDEDPSGEPERLDVPVGSSPSRGPKNAPVTLVEFGDFQCPFTSRAAETVRQLLARYPGRLRVVFKHEPLPFHPQARELAKASWAANAHQRFWEFHDAVFSTRAGFGGNRNLDALAVASGLDAERLLAESRAPAAEQAIAADEALAKRLGATSTPTFFINGRKLGGAQPLAKFAELIDDELRRAGLPVPPPVEEPVPTAGGPVEGGARPAIPLGRSPVRGAANAPVTLVEFGDLECPFTKGAQPKLNELLRRYPGKLRIVFKHQPLPFHAQARELALRSVGAQQFGAFWEFLDWTFAVPGSVAPPLDSRRVQEVAGSTLAASQVDEDIALARRLGADGTPTFFINGRTVVGNQPLEAFTKVIDEELRSAGR